MSYKMKHIANYPLIYMQLTDISVSASIVLQYTKTRMSINITLAL